MIESEIKLRPATRRYLAKKDRIVAAATQVLNGAGIGGFTLSSVATAVRAHPASIGYYWRKDTLIAACILDAAARIRVMAEQALAAPSPGQRVAAFMAAYFDERRRIWTGEAADLADFAVLGYAGPIALEGYVAMFRAIGRLFVGGPTAPDGRSAAPWSRLTIEQLGWSRHWLANPRAEDFDRAARAMTDLLTQGLAGEGRAWPAMSPLDLAPAPADPQSAPREAFLAAGTQMLNGHGYRGASVDRISAQLGRTKGAFYHHHADKDEVIEACFEHTFDITRAALARASAASNGWEKLAFAAAALAASHNSRSGLLVRTYALAGLPPDMRARMVVGFDEAATHFAAFVEEGMADGSIRRVDPHIAGMMMVATINSSAYLNAWAPQIKRDDVIDAYVRPALMGLLRGA